MVVHMSWVQERTAGMRVEAGADLVVVDSGLPSDTFNFVCRARLHSETMRARIEEVIAYFAAARRPFSWWVGPADQPVTLGPMLQEMGLVAAESEVAMAAELSALNPTDLAPHGLRIERASTEQHLRDFAAITAANWMPPDAAVFHFYERAVPALLAPEAPLWLYVGYLDDEPVAASELTVGGGVAGLYNISTRATHRRKGFGSALTLRPLLDARARGLKSGILQAAADGVGVYTRLGFRAVGHFTEYQPVPA